MVMDHRDCGAYKVILGEDCCQDKETAAHAEKLKELRKQIVERADLARACYDPCLWHTKA